MKLFLVKSERVMEYLQSGDGGDVNLAFLEANAYDVVDSDGTNDCVAPSVRLITLINSGESEDTFAYLTDGENIFHA